MKKKRILLLSILLMIGILFGCTANTPAQPLPDTGATGNPETLAIVGPVTAKGESVGKHGPIVVELTVENGEITTINVLEQTEHYALGKAAFETITADVLAMNSPDADIVSGATATSVGFKTAIQNALKNGGITLGDSKQTDKREEELQVYDVVVLGSGGAGMSAAIEARKAGASVVIIEKTGAFGGNTALSGQYNGAGTRFQKALDIPDTPDVMFEDIMKGGDFLSDEKLVRILADKSAETVEWTVDEVGVELDETFIAQFDVASYPRAHNTALGNNSLLVVALKNKCDELGVAFKMSTRATELLIEDGTVTGAKAVTSSGQEITFHANKGVVLATGGFAANLEMVGEYCPEKKGYLISTNAPSITGDGIIMAKAIGANLVGMEHVQTNPSGNPKTGELMLFAGYGKLDGGFVVNKEGKRFVNDADRRDVQCAAYLQQTDSIVYYVWGNEVDQKRKNYEINKKDFDIEASTGSLIKADTLKECADYFGVDYQALEETCKHYNEMVRMGKDTDFGRTSNLTVTETGPYYMASVTPSVHHTMGGVEINIHAQVLDTNGNVIKNLYAAGEVTGGIHGSNRLGGNAVTDAMTFGRIAGQNVVK